MDTALLAGRAGLGVLHPADVLLVALMDRLLDTVEARDVGIDLVGAFHCGGGRVFLAAGKQCGERDRRGERRITKLMGHLAFH